MEEKAAEAGTAQDKPAAGCLFCATVLPVIERLFGEDTRDHFRNSRIEFLKGVRSMIDERITYLSRAEEQKGTRVTVE